MSKVFEKHLFVCTSGKKCPQKADVNEMQMQMKAKIVEKGLADKIRVNKSGCLGWCEEGPAMVCYPEGIWYTNVTPEDTDEIVESHLINNIPVERLVYKKE
jgi:(2Fe-2S) ferredoxin